jgi:beta-glucanase (GH16 family)
MNKLVLGTILFFFTVAAAKDYNGAELYSKSTVKYGRFDVRMRTMAGSGIISSFFTYYNNSYLGSPEPWMEIDIETLGKNTNIFQTNIITGNAASKITSEQVHSFDNLSQNYHTYTVEWTPNYIVWLFDGKEVRRTTGSQVTACQAKEMSYRFNAWISNVPEWAGSFNPSILPVYQYINWVKFSRYTPGAGPNGSDFTADWQDNFDTFDGSRWGKGDWTFDGNLVDFSPNNIVVKDGYCIICLTRIGATGFSGEVPKDQASSIIKFDRAPRVKFPSSGFRQTDKDSYFGIALDGRIIPRGSDFSCGKTSGVLIARENNKAKRTVQIAR